MNNKLTPQNMAGIFNGRKDNQNLSVNDVMAILLQITLALLMVFFIADMLFRHRVEAEFDQLKGMLKFYRQKMQEIQSTDAGTQYKLREEALIDKQKQILLTTLNEIEKNERDSLGITFFSYLDQNRQIEFNISGLLIEDKITDNSLIRNKFIRGCQLAREKLIYQGRMEKDWLERVLSKTGLIIKPENVTITNEPFVLVKENEIWLKQEIGKRVKNVYIDCRNLQRTAIRELQDYYLYHPEKVTEEEIFKLIDKYYLLSEENRKGMISLISKKVHEHAKKVFEQQQAPFLADS